MALTRPETILSSSRCHLPHLCHGNNAACVVNRTSMEHIHNSIIARKRFVTPYEAIMILNQAMQTPKGAHHVLSEAVDFATVVMVCQASGNKISSMTKNLECTFLSF